MAFDPETGQIILFGGYNGSSGRLSDTWAYTIPSVGVDWSQLNPATSPTARAVASMAFDPATGQLVLFGGTKSGARNDTWAWDGSTWHDVTPTSGNPPARSGASMAFDPATGQLILFGGNNGYSSYFNDTWSWDGTSWTNFTPASGSPAVRGYASMAFDPLTGQLILFGGYNGGYLNDTWAWDGSSWIPLNPAASPSVRQGSSMAFDPATGQFILFGGTDNDSYLNDTWAWDGSTWTTLSPATSPSARRARSLAFNPAIGQLILFGGYSFRGYGNSGFLGDTWAWDGSTWTQLSPVTSPLARYLASMAFDPATGQLILFGGVGSSGSLLNDTWELTVVADTTPPVTTATATNADTSSYTFGDWTNQSVTVTLSATDESGGSGVASTSYTVDGGSTQSYSVPFTVSGEGDHTVTFWSVSTDGNTESAETVHVLIDLTDPTTSATATNADTSSYTFGTWTNQSVTVTLSATMIAVAPASPVPPTRSTAAALKSYSDTVDHLR